MTSTRLPFLVLAALATAACGQDAPGSASDAVTESDGHGDIAIHQAGFFPEGSDVDRHGYLFVGSLGGHGIVEIDPATHEVRSFIDGADTRSIVGVRVDDEGELLWACDVDLAGGEPARLLAYDLFTAELVARFDFPAGGFCNDIALDDISGDVYATDTTLGAIRRVRWEGDQLEEWLVDEAFMPEPGAFGPNGIVLSGGDLYMVRFDTAELFRITMNAELAAEAVHNISWDNPPKAPDGLTALEDGRIAVVDNFGGRVLAARIEGDVAITSVLRDALDTPATAALHDGHLWVTESQVDHLLGFDPAPASEPFFVREVLLDCAQ